jgi:hypothetical protein
MGAQFAQRPLEEGFEGGNIEFCVSQRPGGLAVMSYDINIDAGVGEQRLHTVDVAFRRRER